MADLSSFDTDELERIADEHLATLNRSLDDLAALTDALIDRDALAGILIQLRDVKARAGEVYAGFEAAVLSEAGERSFVVPQFGRFEVKPRKKRTGWVWDRLVPDLVTYARVEEPRRVAPSTGEVESEGEVVARVMRDCVSMSGGKVTGLRARGIQPDAYCNEEDDGWTLSLPPVDVLRGEAA